MSERGQESIAGTARRVLRTIDSWPLSPKHNAFSNSNRWCLTAIRGIRAFRGPTSSAETHRQERPEDSYALGASDSNRSSKRYSLRR